MYYLIENWKITWSSELYLSSDKWTTIEKDFTQEEIQKISSWYFYNIVNWELEETEESKQFNKQALENQKTQIEKELVEVNGLIEWAKRLKEMWIFDEDDELELAWYETKAQELIIKRSEIKAKLKELL